MVLMAITFILQVLTVAFYNIESAWTITTIEGVNITIGSVILWYLCIAVIFYIMARLISGSILKIHGGKHNASR